MNINNEDIIQLIKKKVIVTSSEVAEEFKVSWNTAEKYLMELLIENKINRMKKTGVTLWMMK
jgi:Mn-dependent DtxR family transcriptional regulator